MSKKNREPGGKFTWRDRYNQHNGGHFDEETLADWYWHWHLSVGDMGVAARQICAVIEELAELKGFDLRKAVEKYESAKLEKV